MGIELSVDPKFSVIVPVYKLPEKVFSRCLQSIADQDYPNFEVIIVFDGIDPELLQIATPYLKDKRFKILEKDHEGACAARNFGFEKSDGEIVSFTNSDYVLKPGCLRLWVDELLRHPDCGFVYGGYDWNVSGRAYYPSKPFDEFQLQVANYIDCGFPLWRKHVVPWDSEVKSLQDWDFWLRVVKNGVKGHYLGIERTFIAEPPRKGGLSNDSSDNWIERVKFVKNKNNIPQPEIVVASLGAPNHGVQIAKMIGADFKDDTIFKPNEYKALYMIGWYMNPKDSVNQHPEIMAFYDKQIKILHFVGADIYWLKKFSHYDLRLIAASLSLKCDYILSENEAAQQELREMGIESQIVPIPPYHDYGVRAWPEEYRVAIFLTDRSDFDKYCKEETLSIVRAMPDIKFSAYGDAAVDINYPNLKCYGNIPSKDWPDFVYDHSAYIRMVRHDTRPMASDEFILAGRDVITNIKAPFMRYIDTTGDPMKVEIDPFQIGLNAYYWPKTKAKIVREIRKSSLGLDHDPFEANEFYSKQLDRKKYIETIKSMASVKKEVPFKEAVNA